jgi:hypothetical protein
MSLCEQCRSYSVPHQDTNVTFYEHTNCTNCSQLNTYRHDDCKQHTVGCVTSLTWKETPVSVSATSDSFLSLPGWDPAGGSLQDLDVDGTTVLKWAS